MLLGLRSRKRRSLGAVRLVPRHLLSLTQAVRAKEGWMRYQLAMWGPFMDFLDCLLCVVIKRKNSVIIL